MLNKSEISPDILFLSKSIHCGPFCAETNLKTGCDVSDKHKWNGLSRARPVSDYD